MTKEQHIEIIKHFESNFLDGDSINDCGGITFTLNGTLDVAEYFYQKGKEDQNNEIIDLFKRHFNGYGGHLGFAFSQIISLITKE